MGKLIVKKFLDQGLIKVRCRFAHEDNNFLYYLGNALEDKYTVAYVIQTHTDSSYLDIVLGSYTQHKARYIDDDIASLIKQIRSIWNSYKKLREWASEDTIALDLN